MRNVCGQVIKRQKNAITLTRASLLALAKSIYQFSTVSIFLSIYLSIYPSIYLSIYLSRNTRTKLQKNAIAKENLIIQNLQWPRDNTTINNTVK